MALPARTPFAPIASLLRLSSRYGVSIWRLHIFALMMLRDALTEPLRQMNHAWRPENPPLQDDPIFVLGHWRSGTSHLQTLLSADPQFTTSTLFDSLLSDVAPVAPWLKGPLNRTARLLGVPYSLQRKPLNFDIPAESDIALLCQHSDASYSWGHIFPLNFEEWLDRWVLNLDDQRAAAWLEDQNRFLRQISAAAQGRRMIVKSPGDTGRVRWLLRQYPDARFVYIHRDPIAVFHSNRYFWSVIRREYSLHHLSDDQVDSLILRTYPKLLERYVADRPLIPRGHLVEIDHADLRDDPIGELTRIYRSLNLGTLPPEVQTTVQGFPRHRPTRYPDDPQLEEQLRSEWAIGFTEWIARR
ncbi:MAG: sulfotransferase [Myxococcota bacterium]